MKKDFKDGVWLAVEHLILNQDQPTIAREICEEADISYKDAEKITNRTKYKEEKLLTTLKSEGLN